MNGSKVLRCLHLNFLREQNVAGWSGPRCDIMEHDCQEGFAGPDCQACEQDTYDRTCTVSCDEDVNCSGHGRWAFSVDSSLPCRFHVSRIWYAVGDLDIHSDVGGSMVPVFAKSAGEDQAAMSLFQNWNAISVSVDLNA